MRPRRIAWLLLALAALSLYLFVNQPGTLALCACLLLLPALSAPALYLPRRKVSAALAAPESCLRGDPVRAELRVTSDRLLPLRVCGTLLLTNVLTGQSEQLPFAARLTRRRPLARTLPLPSAHCGRLQLACVSLYCEDFLGLFRKKLPAQAAATLFVCPRPRPLALELAESPEPTQAGERYSAQSAGLDPAETFRIRDYAPGDPLHRIHWKLSEKTDRLLVRELGLPEAERLALLFETVRLPGAARTPAQADLLLELLASAAQALLARQTPFLLAFPAANGALLRFAVDAPEAFDTALRQLLSTPLHDGTQSACAAFAAENVPTPRVAVFSPAVPPALGQLCRGGAVSLLLPAENLGKAGLWENGAAVLPVTPDTAALTL